MGTIAANKRAGNILAKYEKSFNNSIALLLSAKKGLKPEAVYDFISVSRLSSNLIEKSLNKTIKTLNSYKDNNILLDPVISEKLLRLFSLYDKGVSIFGSSD